MSKRHLIRGTLSNGKSQWWHCSVGTKNSKLRNFGQGDRDQSYTSENLAKHLREVFKEYEEFSLQALSAWALNSFGYDLRKLGVDETSKWREVLEKLTTERPFQNDQMTSASDAFDGIVQVTALRRRYLSLRANSSLGFHEAECLSHLIGDSPEEVGLQSDFEDSMAEFAGYQNENEGFHSRKTPSWRQSYLHNPNSFAHCVVARLGDGRKSGQCPVHVVRDAESNVRAVDYEIFTMRTTGGATFPNGAKVSSQGSGGLDLLLDWDGVPTVGEVKAPGDTNMYLALTQALMYATELATPSQLQRLRKHYPNSFSQLANDSKVAIAIIHSSSETPKLFDETTRLAKMLMDDESLPVPQRIEFIAFVEATLSDAGEVIELDCQEIARTPR